MGVLPLNIKKYVNIRNGFKLNNYLQRNYFFYCMTLKLIVLPYIIILNFFYYYLKF